MFTNIVNEKKPKSLKIPAFIINTHIMLHVVILAAGRGKRMQSSLPKVLHPLAGKPLLEHVINTAQGLNPGSNSCCLWAWW